jgi:hypothetical protein
MGVKSHRKLGEKDIAKDSCRCDEVKSKKIGKTPPF